MWMQKKMGPYKLLASPGPVSAINAAVAGVPTLAGGLSAPASEKGYSQLKTSWIQVACGLTDTQWDTDLPELYTGMLEEGRTMAHVKVLLEDTFWPDDMLSLNVVYLGVTVDMVKDVKELNLGYNNNMSYDTCHHGISPFTIIRVSMSTASKQRRHANSFLRTSNLTLAEVTTAETTPNALPTEYHGGW
jgi:hypothetical protein